MPVKLEDIWPSHVKPVIGMVHLLPLPGAPRYGGDVEAIWRRALDDAAALVAGGIHGLMLENFGDAPFFPGRVPAAVATHMTAIAAELRRRFAVPLGLNVLRNDGMTALAVAHAVGAQFVRVNVLCGARVTDQGLVQGIAHDLLRERAALGAEIAIFADVNVKHSAPLAARPVADEVADLLQRGGADAVIVSGAGTGQAADRSELTLVKAAAGTAPVWVGSGIAADNLADYAACADGLIVGTSVKRGGRVANPVDETRVRTLIAAWERTLPGPT